MKKTLTLTCLLAVLATTLLASLDLPPYDKTKPPGLPLPLAYQNAINALGSDTNQFHCISAKIATDFSPEGEWHFTFCSTNSKVLAKFVVVKFDGKAIFDSGFR